MLKRCYALIIIVFILVGCAHRSQEKTVVIKHSTVSGKQFRQVNSFNQIDVKGPLNVTLHTGYRHPEVILKGDPRDLIQVKTYVKQNTLYVTLEGGYPKFGAVSADVRGRYLNRLSYNGAGYLTGTQLSTSVLDVSLANQGTTKLGGSIGLRHLEVKGGGFTQISGITSPYLQIHFKDNPKVYLSGVVNLTSLKLDGSGWLSLYWVKSNALTIRAKKKAKIQLAGTVNKLDLELWGYAQFKGRYLRAQRTFIKTHDHSVAEISSVNHQSNLATDASDIYYYNLPNTRADFMAFNGSVLDMRDWNQKDLRDFDRFNKQFP